MATFKERIELIQKYIDEGHSLSFAKFAADKDLGVKFKSIIVVSGRRRYRRLFDDIINDPAYIEMKKNYKKKIKKQRSFHKCVE